MKFLVIGRCLHDFRPVELQTLQAAESKILWELYGAGILREAQFGRDMDCLSLILECRNSREAIQLVKMLPSAKSEMIFYQVSELTGLPALSEQFVKHRSPLPIWLD